ncbi:hypothetical protein G4G28_16155 [Massilia sp. Dwa41.01b]|uniref:hypothetical protein n=1 Tax=unclassified Massilia TaxID=2609279 RepID=UPI0015FF58B0|nr:MULTISPECIES: hypothetical protein [unclassified Massilia]QNA89621.1 hypothetical protein G4G28_16155 [Massilia sp. Dwa41.01b]QNB00519.1 hypothetical protein G4G31_19730 [Massilia sp. Se16.2.3]
MNKLCALILVFAVMLNASAGEPASQAGGQKSCTIGPTEKTFGKTKWLVYGCDDATMAVIVSAAGNPAGPFYFAVYREAGRYRIVGEGTGSKTASGAALKDLQALSDTALDGLVREAARPKP